jgi:hypothetical protein
MKLKLISDEPASSTFEGKEKRFRRIIAQGMTDFNEQFVEIQLPETDKRQIGAEFEFRLKSVSSLFQGKARLQGEVVAGK